LAKSLWKAGNGNFFVRQNKSRRESLVDSRGFLERLAEKGRFQRQIGLCRQASRVEHHRETGENLNAGRLGSTACAVRPFLFFPAARRYSEFYFLKGMGNK